MIFFETFRRERIARKLRAAEEQLAWLVDQHCPLCCDGIKTIRGDIEKLLEKQAFLSKSSV